MVAKLAALLVCFAAAWLMLGLLVEPFVGWYSGVDEPIPARAWIDWSLQLVVVDARRMVDRRDGPCHSDPFRARFWTDVLKSLELDEELILDEARAYHARFSDAAELPALEARIAEWRRQRQP